NVDIEPASSSPVGRTAGPRVIARPGAGDRRTTPGILTTSMEGSRLFGPNLQGFRGQSADRYAGPGSAVPTPGRGPPCPRRAGGRPCPQPGGGPTVRATGPGVRRARTELTMAPGARAAGAIVGLAWRAVGCSVIGGCVGRGDRVGRLRAVRA